MTVTPASPQKIWIYDTTLRDGAQREGIALSLDDKVRIARQLDAMGIPFIEGGWPGANPKDVQFFWQIKEKPLKNSELVAFCSTRRPHRAPEDDELLQAILSAGTRWVTLFGKSWDLHVSAGLKTSLEENLAMIEDSIGYLRSQGRRLIYDAEHWFDGYKHNPDYALKTLGAAIAGGAEWLVLCDTNGGCLPHEIAAIVEEVCNSFDLQLNPSPSLQAEDFHDRPRLGIHTHNDSETAVANAIAAVMEGATMVQGTMNGYGERCGNANLCSLIPNLQLKLGYDCLEPQQLTQLTRSSHLISEMANLAPNDHAAFVGLSAFAHKGGIHVSAVERNPLTYEHIAPESVGNNRRIVVSEQSGLSNILAKARTFGIELDKQDPVCRQILQQLKELEHEGYQFEAAEASFDLLMRQAMGQRPQFFGLKGFQVHCVTQDDGSILSLATIKVCIKGQDILEAGECNGPVSALDVALRRAIVQFYPEVKQFNLTDYKVRVLGGTDGPAARTRVLAEFSDGSQHWSTVGVSYNIIEASYKAVVEGLEYGLLLHHVDPQGEANATIGSISLLQPSP
ncbi:citramalate synthase [Prochlorothrix hollandica]|uniref:Citramalate synthase n=1 Tax=Prochlorothrix hollandica PCC 9006 = CALU 1027 TaxID=317619 RepID=A0A0M2PWK9_PROHO|nr:citramalate synthase [Prochlorothrix hollandica]KKI99063.1 transferase [Prochlorothrix hollandica PCC 9006 = CALU 1027]